jgi:hypothetical protein
VRWWSTCLVLVAVACGREPTAASLVISLTPPRTVGPGPGPAGPAPLLRWAAVDGATRYEVEVERGCAVAACRFAPPTARAVVEDLAWAAALPHGRVVWRVRACASATCSPWSRPRATELAAHDDVDGDGFADAAAAAPLARGDRGAVLVIRGGPREAPLRTQRVELPGSAAGDELGASVAFGDLDGDGRAELIVGAPGFADGAGRLYVFTGTADGPRGPTATLEVPGHAGDALGASVVCGDFDGDGFVDVAAAAPGADGERPDQVDVGKVLVWRGGPALLRGGPPTVLAAADPTPFDRFGSALAAADLDGDGRDELIVGGPGIDRAGHVRGRDRGAVLVFRGDRDGPAQPPRRLEAEAPTDHDRFGFALATLDLDGDGYPDLVVGAPAAPGAAGGAVYAYRGGPHGLVSPAFATLRDATHPRFGTSVAPAGDLDDDGRDELAIGTSGAGRGVVLIYRGGAERMAPTPMLTLTEELGDFADVLAGGSDLDGDGRSDLIVGADLGRDQRGSILVYRGVHGGFAPPTRLDGPSGAQFGRVLSP